MGEAVSDGASFSHEELVELISALHAKLETLTANQADYEGATGSPDTTASSRIDRLHRLSAKLVRAAQEAPRRGEVIHDSVSLLGWTGKGKP